MNETQIFDYQLERTMTASRIDELDHQLALLLTTRTGTMPLDREFGIDMDFVDKPPELAKVLYTQEVTKQVAKFISWVRVKEITWSHGAQGQIIPKVVITSA